MIRNGKVSIECRGYLDQKVFYRVGSGNYVMLTFIGNKPINCTCKAHSIKGLAHGTCSFILAVQKYGMKTEQEEKIK